MIKLHSLYHAKHRHATWLELFFDLVFVAVIGVIAHDLAHTHDKHISLEQLARFPMVFIPIWWIWITHTLFANRFDNDTRSQRFISLCIMGLLVILSTYAKTSLTTHFNTFVIIYVVIRIFLAFMYGFIYYRYHDDVRFTKDITLAVLVGALISTSAIFIDTAFKFVLFYAGIFIDMLWQISIRHKTVNTPVHLSHLVERMGLLAIIILGESMIAMVASLSDVRWQLHSIIGATAGFALVGAIWWVYFDSFATLEKGKRLTSANILIYSHMFVCMGLLILANLIRHTILDDLDNSTFRLLAITGLIFFYLGKQIPYWYAFPPWRTAIFRNTLLCVSITVLSSFLPYNQLSLIGMMCGMLIYVYFTHKYILHVSVDNYLVKTI